MRHPIASASYGLPSLCNQRDLQDAIKFGKPVKEALEQARKRGLFKQLADKVKQTARRIVRDERGATKAGDDIADGARSGRGASDDVASAGRGPSTPMGSRIEDFKQNPDDWRRVSAHAEGATGRRYRGGTSIEEVFESQGDRLVRHRIYGRQGDVLHQTFRPYAKFGAE